MNKYCLFLLLFIFLFSACRNKVERNTLNAVEKVVYDSLNIALTDSIRRKSDSICMAQRDTMYALAVDSLLRIRLLEIQNLVEDEK
ncbi:MAG TPA: hypothetical protein PLY70_00060 [Saprospiraceae bacterium]|nr:hypothetical protein [Saprospiraceae bacterium]HPN67890.1 hypothetical protein [Saprospiraceae bacterium]